MLKHSLPLLDNFVNGNGYTGNCGEKLLYKIVADGALKAYVWEGPFCYDYAVAHEFEMQEQEFELSQEGLDRLKEWLDQLSE